MNERSIFVAALEKDDPADRAAFLDTACAGDAALRQRVEALLGSHAGAGTFLGKPAPQRLAEELAAGAATAATQGEPPAGGGASDELSFLTPADKPDVLGRLGHYDILEVVGRGGMGVVLRAFDAKLHRVVAIKVMAAPLAASATARKRFTREAQAQAAISHDHVVTIHAVEEANGLPYLVMQYVAGASLQERLNRGGPLELHEVLRIGMQMAAGLAAAHAQGLIHRDVKPANILLENGVERVKIADFGLARAADDASLTQSGVVAGTPPYMSPEQARGEPVDPRSDLFSLGSVLYAMCTGRPPFRAGGSMAVLRRVSDETPTPVRDSNPTIPDWLAAIIEKLHAKDPAGRYQSAGEVAELLGQHLAHVQHPSVMPAPAVVAGSGDPPVVAGSPDPATTRRPRGRGRRWAAVAAVVVCLLGGLSLAEATGVTHVAATVIRIFTPEGTLVVETDDPAVKVTVEGDGDLVISGAGPQEVRLRPGSYKVQATKDGKPVAVDRDLVTITHGGRQVVRVRMEEQTPAAAAVPKAEAGAFVLLGGQGVTERKFDTLAEAVIDASDGDTIEVRGNGPFECNPITVRGTALTIRAAQSFRPVLRLENGERVQAPLLQSDSLLVLEGLELQRLGKQPPVAAGQVLVADHSPLYVGNCRLFMSQGLNAVTSIQSPRCTLRNCELVIPASGGVDCVQSSRGELDFENCLALSPPHLAFAIHYLGPSADEALDLSVRLGRNTWVCGGNGMFFCQEMEAGPSLRPIRIETAANLFDVGRVLALTDCRRDPKPLSRADAQTFLSQLVSWRGRDNVYPEKLASWVAWPDSVPDKPGINGVAEWGAFWGTGETDSCQARTRYNGGDLRSKAATSPESVAPDDFRLRPDSAGYRAGKDGQDLGADVDLVGPGPAYERWKKTPEYRQWLKDTGQKK